MLDPADVRTGNDEENTRRRDLHCLRVLLSNYWRGGTGKSAADRLSFAENCLGKSVQRSAEGAYSGGAKRAIGGLEWAITCYC